MFERLMVEDLVHWARDYKVNTVLPCSVTLFSLLPVAFSCACARSAHSSTATMALSAMILCPFHTFNVSDWIVTLTTADSG